jgi:hypothetical protein
MNGARLTKYQYDLWVKAHLDEINCVIDEQGLTVQPLAEGHVAFPGFGVFAKRIFRIGEFFEGYLGIALTHSQFKVKYGKEKAVYVLKLSRGRFICAEDPQTSNFWRYVNSNHGTSLLPNVAPLNIGYGTTLRQINIGEEFLFDYGLGFTWATASNKHASDAISDALKPHHPIPSGSISTPSRRRFRRRADPAGGGTTAAQAQFWGQIILVLGLLLRLTRRS